jgi:hypothetical protein
MSENERKDSRNDQKSITPPRRPEEGESSQRPGNLEDGRESEAP